MLNSFARLGKKPWAKQIMPAVFAVCGLGYYAKHSLFLGTIKSLFAAQAQDGRPESMSDKLDDLTRKTFEEVKEAGYLKPFGGVTLLENGPFVEWFITSSSEPFIYGGTESRSGLLIGLPVYYNYDKKEDLPENFYKIEKLGLFGGAKKSEEEETQDRDRSEISGQENDGRLRPVSVKEIDRHSKEAEEYADTLILSDNAKKYSFARLLYLGTFFQSEARLSLMALCMLLTLTFARGSVAYAKLNNKHLAQRFPFYSLAGLLGIGCYSLMGAQMDDYFNKLADDKVIALGDNYKLGAEEYNSKKEKRFAALEALNASLK